MMNLITFHAGDINMTREELAEELMLSPSYLLNHWPKVVRVRAAVGIELYKIGRGDNAQYGIKSYGDEEIRWEKKELI